MATSATITRFIEAIRADGISDPYAYAVGALGAMVSEEEVISHINYITARKAN